ncbi:MAG TPA: DNA-directed RNA polymerase subunit D [Candidatus Nanoarchaeia archaeon]|nr:DNA-directed RNA polymerase subunit D [Candidatus Nanoarchaeia archaeon]
MKIEKLNEDKKNGKLTFLLKDSDEVFANTIRRLIIEEVPTLAVEDLEIRDNSSALYDEMLALRLGLLPIKTDLKSYNLKNECKCENEGCAQCELTITLKSNKKGSVLAGEAISTDPKCKFVHDNMPIVKLLAKQKIDVTMKAILGQGKEHTKWSPGTAFYKKEAVVKIGKVKDPVLLAKNCTDGVFTIKGSNVTLNKDKIYSSNLLDTYAELNDGITVDHTNNLVFTVENWGQLSNKEILQRSADILKNKAEEMEKLI